MILQITKVLLNMGCNTHTHVREKIKPGDTLDPEMCQNVDLLSIRFMKESFIISDNRFLHQILMYAAA